MFKQPTTHDAGGWFAFGREHMGEDAPSAVWADIQFAGVNVRAVLTQAEARHLAEGLVAAANLGQAMDEDE